MSSEVGVVVVAVRRFEGLVVRGVVVVFGAEGEVECVFRQEVFLFQREQTTGYVDLFRICGSPSAGVVAVVYSGRPPRG